MRKVRYCVGVSLDGYLASSDGSFEWLNRALDHCNEMLLLLTPFDVLIRDGAVSAAR